MKKCCLCKKKQSGGAGTFFNVPVDDRRLKWSKICDMDFSPRAIICIDHFKPSSIAFLGRKRVLLPIAVPILPAPEQNEVCSSYKTLHRLESPKKGRFSSRENPSNADAEPARISRKENIKTNRNEVVVYKAIIPNSLNSSKNVYQSSSTEKYVYSTGIPPRQTFSENQDRALKQNSSNTDKNYMPPQLDEPVVQMPVVKSVSYSGYTQTNIRLCGLVEASDFADEFRFNCFYCSEVFALEKWKHFVHHLKEKHFKEEEAFNTTKYLSKEHDYTPVNLASANFEPVACNAGSTLPSLTDPLASVASPFESVVFSSNLYCTPYKTEAKPNIVRNSSGEKSRGYKKNSKRRLISSNRFYSKFSEPQTAKRTALSRCLKRSIEDEIKPHSPSESEDYETLSVTADQENPTEISFEYTTRPIVSFLLENMKRYPVLWQFDDEPFNEDFFEATQDLCNVINSRFSLNIDNLKMRRSINRILRFYCYLFPNENDDKFTYYYDICASFLPSVSEIAYARCPHCYVCYKSDFDLKLHLVEEQRYLEWTYKCSQCKESFRLWDEFEFHKRLPHYDEIFRCQPCKLSFFRRLAYKKHMVEEHQSVTEPGVFKCDICDKSVETLSGLRQHKKTHGLPQHKCHICLRTYHEKSKLELHLKIHRKELDFMCEICGKKFCRQPALKVHMTKHTGEKVTCKICNLRLRKSSLSRHLRVVHVPMSRSVVSGKQINLGRILKAKPRRRPLHKKVGNEREYKCKICNILFDNYKLIVEHNKMEHSDLPKWPCKMCSTEFNSKLNLKGHYRRKHKLHALKVYKLVEENEDLDNVLSMKTEDIEEIFQALKNSRNNPETSNAKSEVKTDLLPDEIYFAEEKVHSSTIQDEIMKAVDDIETEDIKIDYMDDMFTDFLE